MEETNGNVNFPSKSAVMLRLMIPVLLKGPGEKMIVNAFLDEASTVTVLDAKVAEELQLTEQTDPLRLRWTNGAVQVDKIVQCSIGSVVEEKCFPMKTVRTVVNLAIPPQMIDVNKV